MNGFTGRESVFLLAALLLACPQQGHCQVEPRVLRVGTGMDYALPSQAARVARPGDVIRIAPGSYSDCARWEADDLVIEGAGSGATITGQVCGDKGLFITSGRNITIRNITFRGAHSGSHNGAGIRAEGAMLRIENSRFIDNENGILTSDIPASTIVIENSVFRRNGNCIEACAHGIYAGHIALLKVENSDFEEQREGHHIKSRAARTEIRNNRIHDGPDGTASYLVDIPNGGSALIAGNDFEKGPRSDNRMAAISIGAEGPKPENPPGEIVIIQNLLANDTGGASAFVLNYTANGIHLQNNRLPDGVAPLRDAHNPAR